MKKFERSSLLDGAVQLSRDEEAMLLKLYLSGDSEAGGRLIQSQIAWIIKLVSRESLPVGVEPEDVVGELLLILLDSLKSYDAEKSELSTYVAVVVQRRARRIIGKLVGKIKCPESSDVLTDVPHCSQDDDRLGDLAEAMRSADLTPEAQLSLDLHLQGLRDDAILLRVRKKYPHVCCVRRLVDDSLNEIRRYMRDLGHDVDVRGDSMLWDL